MTVHIVSYIDVFALVTVFKRMQGMYI